MEEIFKRVSIRKYEDRPVEPEKLERIMRAAMAAPSAGNQQPWEFYVVTNKDKIKELASASRFSGCAADAPVVIVPCYRKRGLRFPEFDQIDLSVATENLLLEITAQGLGGVWLAIAPIDERMCRVEETLGIDSDILRAFALVPLGHPAEEKTRQDRYDEKRVHFID